MNVASDGRRGDDVARRAENPRVVRSDAKRPVRLPKAVRMSATQWTPTSETTVGVGGKVTTTFHSQPTFRRTAAGWTRLSGKLKQRSGAFTWRAAETAVPTDFAAIGSKVMRLNLPTGAVPISLNGARLSDPAVRQPGRSHYLSYREVLDGVDLQYRVQGSQIAQALVVREPTAGREFRFDFADPQHRLGTPRQQSDGSIRFSGAVGGYALSLGAAAVRPVSKERDRSRKGETLAAKGWTLAQDVVVTDSGYRLTATLEGRSGAGGARATSLALETSLNWGYYTTADATLSSAFAPVGCGACPLSAHSDGSVYVTDQGAETHAYFHVNLSNFPASTEVTQARFGVGYNYGFYGQGDLHKVNELLEPGDTGADLLAAEDPEVIGSLPNGWFSSANGMHWVDVTEPVSGWVGSGTGGAVGIALRVTGGVEYSEYVTPVGSPSDCIGAGSSYLGPGCYFNPSLEVEYSGLPLPPPIPVEQTWGCDCRWAHGADNTGTVADPVKTADSSAFETVTDVATRAPGIPVSFRRTYNGADTTDGPLGVGWTFEYNASLTEDAITGAVTFRDPTGGQSRFTQLPAGEYLNDPGVTGRLVKLTGGAGWTLTSLAGEKITFDAQGREVSDVNRNGDGVTLTYTSVAGGSRLTGLTDAAGAITTVAYGTSGAGAGKISSVSTPDARVVRYAYQSVNGQARLQKVTGADAKITTLSYDPVTGRLNMINSPGGAENARNVYDSQGRVIKQTDAGGNEWLFETETGPDPDTVTHTTTDPLGGVTQDLYYGNVRIQHTDADGAISRWFYDANLNLIAATDPNGNTTGMSYNEAGDMTGRELPDGTSESWTYDTDHHPLTHTDQAGNTTTSTYDSAGRMTSVTDALGHTTSYTYDTRGLMLTRTSPGDRVTTWTYDAQGNPTSTTSPGGNKTTHTYDTAGNLASTIAPRGNVTGATPATYTTKYTYDKLRRLTKQTDPDGSITTNVYDSDGNLTSSVKKKSTTTVDQITNTYDPLHRLLSTSQFTRTTSHTYDAVGHQLSTTDPTGAVTSYTYSPGGRRLTMTSANGNATGADPAQYTWSYSYDANGNQFATSDPTGATTSTSYDALNRPVTTTDSGGNQTTTGYDPVGRVTSLTDPMGRVTTTTYDEAGHTIAQALPDQDPTTWTYSPDGLRTAQVSPSGNSTITWTYTPDGQVATQVDPTGNTAGGTPAQHTTSYTYDPDGNRLTVTNPLGRATTNTYDRLGRLTKTTNAANIATSYTYDAAGNVSMLTAPGSAYTSYGYNQYGNLTSRTDANNQATTFTVDDNGRSTSRTDPLGRTTTTSYDPEGHPTTVTNPSGTTTTTTYDSTGRVISAAGAATPTGTATVSATFDYDPAGRVASVTDQTGVTAYGYNSAGQLTSFDQPGADDYTYAYNPAGQLETRTQPAGGTLTYTYNTDGLLATQNSDGATTGYTYNPDQQLATTTLPAAVGRIQTRAYDPAGNLAQIATTTSGAPTPLAAVAYTRNAVGQPTQVSHTHASTTTTESYAYNTRGWLARWCPTTSTCTTTTPNKVSYGYDKVGNQTTRAATGTAPGPTNTVTSYDAANQATTEQRTGGANPGTTTYTYNADGQLTTGGRTYDPFGQLTGQTTSNGTASYTYNGLGLRRTSTDTTGTTNWSWDPNNPIPLLAATTTTSATTVHRYDPVGTPLASVTPSDPTKSTWYATDAQGSVTDTLTNTGALARTYTYDPWGATLTNTTAITGAPQAAFGYTGATPIPGTDTYYLRARDYDPTTSRFTTLDPHPQDPNDPWLTDYGYVGNQPTLYTDPTGLCIQCRNPFSELSDEIQKVVDKAVDAGEKAVKATEKYGHTGLDVVGLIPGYGEAADGLNAAWYGLEGDWTNAGLSCAGMIPFLGWGSPIIKHGDEALGLIKRSPNGSAANGGSKIPWTSWQNYPKVTQGGREYAQVGDRLYTRHAVDRMQPSGLGAPVGASGAGRSISPNYIEDVLTSTRGVPAKGPLGEPRLSYTSGTVQVITENNIVITVITR